VPRADAPRSSPDGFRLLCAFLGGAVLLFIAAPIAGLFLHASPGSVTATAADPEVRASIWLTLWTSMVATLACSLGAVPLAYVLARKEFPLKNLVTAVIDLPVLIPHSAAGIALLGVLSRRTLAGATAERMGFSFVNHPAGIAAAMAFVSIPFLINAARDGFAAVPAALEEAALSLGASPARVFFTVSLPLARRSVLSGLILMWARGMSEFGAVVIMAYHPRTTPVLIFTRFNEFGMEYVRPLAVLFIGVCLLFFLLLRIIGDTRRRAVG